MPLLAILDEAAFNALPDATSLGKDSYLKDEKTGAYVLAMDGSEASKLAKPLSDKIALLEANNKKLLDEKVKAIQKLEEFTQIGSDDFEKRYGAQIATLKAEHQRQLDASKAELEKAQANVDASHKHLISTMTRTRIAELKNTFGLNDLADDWLGNRIQVVYDEDNQRYVERVVENGEVAYKGQQYKTPQQLISEAQANKAFAGMFNAGSAGGSGAPGRQQSGAAGADRYKGLSAAEKLKQARSDGIKTP